jgi:hypothetical protein
MSTQIQEITQMLEILPEQEQTLAVELLKRLVRAWDSDYTKLTPKEEQELKEAENSGYINADDIDWDNLDDMILD